MKFLALAAVYNHGQQWIETLVQSMIDQDHDDDITMMVIDDRIHGFGQFCARTKRSIHNGHKRDVRICPMKERASNLLAKYAHGLNEAAFFAHDFDAVCVIDDDDIYLTDHISQHAKVLQTHPWSYPDKVFSTFGHRFNVEGSGGRFWASSAYRRTALDAIGGYANPVEDTLHPAFDQLFLHRMQTTHGEAGHQEDPTYIYMWDMTSDNHSSGHIEDGLWKYQEIPESPATGPLVPRYSAKALEVLEMAKPFRGRKPE